MVDTAPGVRQHGVLVGDIPAILREIPAVVFVNPLAGEGRAGKYLSDVREVFQSRKIPAEFLLTDSPHDLESRARGAIADGRRMLFAMGGDGTLQLLVNVVYGSDVLLGLLPTGGGNDFAAALGLPHDPVAAVRTVLSGTPRLVDVMRARTGDGQTRLYIGGGGVGLDVEAARHAAGAYHHLPGRLRYVASGLRALREFKPPRIRAEFPGSGLPPIEEAVLFAAVFNTPSYGSGVRLAPGARIDDGSLDVALVEDLNALQIMALLPGVMLRGTLPESYIKHARASRVVLSSDPPCLFHGDGEIFGPTPVEIEVVPRAIRILAPPAR
jgi:diacylglycerol kinase (ATP)